MREIPTKHGFKALVDDQNYALVSDIVLDEQNGWFEPEIEFATQFARNLGGTLVDVGANVGVYSLAWLANGGQGAIAFEPNPLILDRLQSNIDANDQQVAIHRCALSNRPGVSNFAARDTEGHLSPEGEIEVPVSTLDEQLATEALAAPVFLKLDAEGADADILSAGLDFLERNDPTIMFERNDTTSTFLASQGLLIYRLLPGSLQLVPDDGKHDLANLFALSPSSLAMLSERGMIAQSLATVPQDFYAMTEDALSSLLLEGAKLPPNSLRLAQAYRAGLALLAKSATTPYMLAFSQAALAMGFREQAFLAAKAALSSADDDEARLLALVAIENSRSWSIAFADAWTLPMLAELAVALPHNAWLNRRLNLMRRLIELRRISAPKTAI